MDHAEAFELLGDLSVEPGRLRSLETDESAEGRAFRRHVATCEACRIELRSLALTRLALAAAAPDTMVAPAEARGRVLGAVAAAGVARGPTPLRAVTPPLATVSDVPRPTATGPAGDAAPTMPRSEVPGPGRPAPEITEGASNRRGLAGEQLPPRARRRDSVLRFRWLALAAAAAVLVFVGGALLGGTLGLTEAPHPAALLAVVNATDDILQQPDHVQLVLQDAAGMSGGSLLLDPASERIVVLSQTLQPVSGARYGCYAVRDGTRTWIGPMFFDAGTAYWAGKATAVPDLGRPGDTVEVRVQGSTGAPALSATFSG